MSDDADFLKALQNEAASADTTPSDQSLSRLNKMGREVVRLDAEVQRLERELKEANIELYDLRTKTMPDLMNELNTDRIGLAAEGVDIVLGSVVHANIAADWPQERKDAGFTHLEELGLGDIVKNTVTVVFPRGRYDDLLEWLEKVRGLNLPFEPPEMNIDKAVPWNTLTATVKEQLRKGTALDLDKLGATVGMIVTIKKRTS